MWVPPLRMEVTDLLNRRKNPFFDHAVAVYFLATRAGEVVGRIAAIHNQLHNEVHADRVGFFGFFDCIREQAVATALIEAAAGWLRGRGLDTLRGPASFSTNDECGLLIEGFDTPNSIMMPHNPPWYQEFMAGAGLQKAKDLYVYRGGSMAGAIPTPDRLVRAVGLTRERFRLTVRTLDLSRFDEEVELIKRLYNQCWEKNWGFVPMTDREIEHLARQFRPVVIPDFVPIVERDGVPIGFGLALPDVNEILRGNRGGRLFPAVLNLLWRLKTHRYTRVRILLLGVVPAFRGKGVDALLYHEIWNAGTRYHHTWGEAGWILEDNPAINLGMQKMGFTKYKTLRLYDRAL